MAAVAPLVTLFLHAMSVAVLGKDGPDRPWFWDMLGGRYHELAARKGWPCRTVSLFCPHS